MSRGICIVLDRLWLRLACADRMKETSSMLATRQDRGWITAVIHIVKFQLGLVTIHVIYIQIGIILRKVSAVPSRRTG